VLCLTTDWTTEFRSPAEAKDFSYSICPDQLWGPPRLLSNGCWRSFPGVKARPGRDADHSPPIQYRGQEQVGPISPLPFVACMTVAGHLSFYLPLRRSEVLTVVKMSTIVFWVVTSCGLVGGYQHSSKKLMKTNLNSRNYANYEWRFHFHVIFPRIL
jgi:hypothetical protein